MRYKLISCNSGNIIFIALLITAMVIVPRNVLGEVIGREDSAHEIALMLDSHKMIKKTLPRIQEIARSQPDVDAFTWEKAMPEMANAIKMDHVGLQIIVAFLYLIVGIGTINTLLMSVIYEKRDVSSFSYIHHWM